MENSLPGTQLRARRLQLGRTLQEIAEKTRITRGYLEALEEGRFDAVPGEVYLSGFLRTYAEELGLEPEPLLRACRTQRRIAAEGARRPEGDVSNSGSEIGRKRVWPAVFLALALVLAAGTAVFAFRWFFPEQGRSEVVEQVRPGETFARHDHSVALLNRPEKGSAEKALPAQKNPISTKRKTERPPPAKPPAQERGARKQVRPSPPTTHAAQPPVPSGGAVLRLQAMAAGTLEVSIDGRDPQSYRLKKGVSLSWNPSRFARVSVDDPTSVKIWLGDRRLDFGGKKEIVLQAKKTTADRGET